MGCSFVGLPSPLLNHTLQRMHPAKFPATLRLHLITTPEARNYLDALCVYNELVAIEPNAIVVLRQKEPKFHAMDPSFIMSMIPQVGEELAERLCERRQMRMDAFTSAASG